MEKEEDENNPTLVGTVLKKLNLLFSTKWSYCTWSHSFTQSLLTIWEAEHTLGCNDCIWGFLLHSGQKDHQISHSFLCNLFSLVLHISKNEDDNKMFSFWNNSYCSISKPPIHCFKKLELFKISDIVPCSDVQLRKSCSQNCIIKFLILASFTTL